jgi:tetratricopeptide (TPR) repeat protein
LLSDIGNQTGALEEIELTSRLDPLSEFSHKSLGWVYFLMGRYEEAIKEEQKARS